MNQWKFYNAPKTNKRVRYYSNRIYVASSNWGHALSVGNQHTASIGLTVK